MLKVLVVDDSESMRGVINYYLTKAGHRVTEAGDGVEGLIYAKQQHYDVIITDINMPEMNGIEFIAKVREASQNRHVPILALTTEKSAAIVEQGKQAGATGWLVKPFDDQTLLHIVNKVAA